MSAPESAVVAPVVEEMKTEEMKTEEMPPVVVAEPTAVMPAVQEAAVEPAAATEEVMKSKEDPPKSPGFLAKLLSNIKLKPRNHKKKEEEKKEGEAATMEEPAVTEPVVAATEPVMEPVMEAAATETVMTPEVVAVAVPEVMAAMEDKAPKIEKTESKTLKVSRRLSARVGDFFKSKPKVEVTTPRVDENPPMIGKPDPVAPLLEDPASEADAAKPVEVAAPVVAAAA